jgi:NADH:ubiquinone oxidoreductase subunit 1 (chain H)
MSGGFLDQIFLRAKEWLLSPLAGAPDWLIQVISSLINISGVLGVFLTLFALISVLERKILGRMQNRYGPNRVGPFGLFQPVADGIKMLIKEDVVPARADKIVHFFAPILVAATAILTLGVIPYGRNMTPFAIDGGILFFFAVGSTTELAVFMAGWGSNNKFSMLGAMRAIAQMVSYELPLFITTLPVVMIVGSLFAGCDCRGPGRLFLWHPPTLVRHHAMGRGGVHFVFCLRSGRIQPHSLRCPGRRIGNCRWPHDRIFRLQIRHLFHGGVFWDVRH